MPNDRVIIRTHERAASQRADGNAASIDFGRLYLNLQPHARRRMRHIRPEDELMLCCARTLIDSATAKRAVSILRAGLDWEYLMRTAQRHGVTPLIYQALQTIDSEIISKSIHHEFRRFFHRNTVICLRLTHELLQILKLFAEDGIIGIPFKGPILAASVYGSLSLRQAGDLDIFVDEEELGRATDLLISQDYRPQVSWIHRTWSPTATTLQGSLEYNRVFLRRPTDPVIELHWSFTEPYYDLRLDRSAIRNRLQPFRLEESSVLTLAPTDLLNMLCVHGARHGWDRLIWICDVAELSATCSDSDWEQVLAQAKVLRIERILFLGLWLARDALGTPLPRNVLAKVEADPVVRWLALRVWEHLFRSDRRPQNFLEWPFTRAGDSVESIRFNLATRECLGDRGRHLLCLVRRVLTPTAADQARMRLPRFLESLSYCAPPTLLLHKLAQYACTRLLGRKVG